MCATDNNRSSKTTLLKTERETRNDANLFKLFGLIQIWYFSTAENIADVLKKRLFQSLGVVKQEQWVCSPHQSESTGVSNLTQQNHHWHYFRINEGHQKYF